MTKDFIFLVFSLNDFLFDDPSSNPSEIYIAEMNKWKGIDE